MAEVTSGTSKLQAKVGVQKAKKLSTRVDLTPMVDLGFLLLTFFIFTTTLNQPTAMSMYLPDDRGEPTPIPQSGALTILVAENTMAYYEGEFDGKGSNLRFGTLSDLRNALINKKSRVKNAKDFVVSIKPSTNSNYKDLVNVLDEMTINDVKRYSLVDISVDEEILLQTTLQSATL